MVSQKQLKFLDRISNKRAWCLFVSRKVHTAHWVNFFAAISTKQTRRMEITERQPKQVPNPTDSKPRDRETSRKRNVIIVEEIRERERKYKEIKKKMK